MWLLFAGLLVALPVCAQDAREIVRTYFERSESRPDRIRNYTYHLRVENRRYRRMCCNFEIADRIGQGKCSYRQIR
jgi:hypothetical protein